MNLNVETISVDKEIRVNIIFDICIIDWFSNFKQMCIGQSQKRYTKENDTIT